MKGRNEHNFKKKKKWHFWDWDSHVKLKPSQRNVSRNGCERLQEKLKWAFCPFPHFSCRLPKYDNWSSSGSIVILRKLLGRKLPTKNNEAERLKELGSLMSSWGHCTRLGDQLPPQGSYEHYQFRQICLINGLLMLHCMMCSMSLWYVQCHYDMFN